MKIAHASALSDRALIAELGRLAGQERAATVALMAPIGTRSASSPRAPRLVIAATSPGPARPCRTHNAHEAEVFHGPGRRHGREHLPVPGRV